jgi:hypothetical protein
MFRRQYSRDANLEPRRLESGRVKPSHVAEGAVQPMAARNAEFFRDMAAPFAEQIESVLTSAGLDESTQATIFEHFPAAPRSRTGIR